MTNKQKIKEEIERLINDKTDGKHVAKADVIAPQRSAYLDILNFINSLPEEPVSEDLKEYYTKEFLPKEWFAKPGHKTISQFNFFTAQHFAEWQKQQMMKDAVEGAIYGNIRNQEEKPYEIYAESDNLPLNGKFKMGDKVKIIIVKEEQQ